MNSNSPISELWNDASCNVAEDYNESPNTNCVYKWDNKASVLANNKNPLVYRLGVGLTTEDLKAKSFNLSHENSECRAMTPCPKFLKQRARIASSPIGINGRFLEVSKFHKVSVSRESSPSVFESKDESSASWKERCKEVQNRCSIKILEILNKDA
ncbi:unnamed protein product [Moneuplotes crassus]|uniref:Uncharacterized protein n=1 Tax=Euplotes crassus TaxID=5936 RepID=A0AAD1U244_EUPCR|nr:unnamed protein product [Moneuplotes crassus]